MGCGGEGGLRGGGEGRSMFLLRGPVETSVPNPRASGGGQRKKVSKRTHPTGLILDSRFYSQTSQKIAISY